MSLLYIFSSSISLFFFSIVCFFSIVPFPVYILSRLGPGLRHAKVYLPGAKAVLSSAATALSSPIRGEGKGAKVALPIPIGGRCLGVGRSGNLYIVSV